MSSKECFHFTKLYKAYSIRNEGLQPKLEQNSRAVGDTKPKISYSDSKIGAIGLFSNFYSVYTSYKNGTRVPRKDKPEEMETYNSVMNSASFEEFLENGMYLIFDGTDIENTGGNTGKGGIYDASTTIPILPSELSVGIIRNNDTGNISYSKFDYIHYLMSTITQEEIDKMDSKVKHFFEEYYEIYKGVIDDFKNGNFSEERISIFDFCQKFKDDIDESIIQNKFISAQLTADGKSGIDDAINGNITGGAVINATNALNEAIRNQENELNQENTNEQGDRN